MVKIIAGLMGSSVGSGSSKLATIAQVQDYLNVCKKYLVNELDTARVYNGGKSEELLGQAQNDDFIIETKAPGFSEGSLTFDNVVSNFNASLSALKKESIGLYYFHGPDRQTPLAESCRAIGQLHKEGKIKHFGISNFRADEVEEIIEICKQNQWILPSVYQGGYNPLNRSGEEGLFPTLRKHGIAFYAYSPLAGGFFSRPSEQLRSPPAGSRMDQMPVFSNLYVNDVTLSWHEKLTAACEAQGSTLKEATLRWLMHHSGLAEQDGLIIGASSTEQLEENLRACQKGALSDAIVETFDGMWKEHFATGKAFPYHV